MYVSSFDLSCATKLSKSGTAAVHRLIVYIYPRAFIQALFSTAVFPT